MSSRGAGSLRCIAVFCGSSPGNDPKYTAAARAFGELAASRGFSIVYGGGNSGMMGAVANAALDAGAHVTGVIPRAMIHAERALDRCSELIHVDTMHERKQEIANRADAFVALPGGIGTFEEILEALTWDVLDIHDKPVGLLNLDGFYSDLIALFTRAHQNGFLRDATMQHLVVESAPAELIDQIAARSREQRDARMGLSW